ncbi:unnamed protein product [Urochloa humidicola]
MWNVLGQAATVAQLVGADVGGLITMIIQAATTAQQNKKECEQLARRVFTVGELLQHLDPEVLRRPEIRRPLAGLSDTLREAHELVIACQDKSAVYRLVLAGRQAERFRDVQSRIDSYLFLFPVISHIDITRRLDRIYNILRPNDMPAGPSSSAISMPQLAVQDSQDIPKIHLKEPHEVQVFTFKELTKATNNFAPDKKIGRGGYGPIYMGLLPDGREVAIKCLETSSSPGREEFNAEVTILRSVSHKHIVRLFGYCVPLPQEKRQLLREFWKKNEQQRNLLVYEFIENRSLDIYLHDETSPSPVTTSWKMRIEILLGVSRAIRYLQSYAERPVIHRDIKPSNILLDASWAPRLADFGLALTWKGPDHDEPVAGTIGYLAPEYAMRGTMNPAIDVYSFGVVMLEVLTGKRTYYSLYENEWDANYNSAKQNNFPHYNFTDLALPLIEAGELWKVLDRRPAVEPTPRQLEAAELVAQAAVRCVSLDWEARPPISEVVATLETALELARCDG